MKPEIVVAFIAASASILAAAITFYLTKRKELEAEWRRHKIEQYKELLLAISGIVGTDATPEGQLRLAKSFNTIVLIASSKVVQTISAYQNEIAASNKNKTIENHDTAVKNLMLAIREDIDLPSKDDPATFPFKLWCSGVSNAADKHLPESLSLPNSGKVNT